MSTPDTRPSIGRLTTVELRKMTDTRAGFWFMLGTVAVLVATVLIRGFTGHSEDHTLRDFLSPETQGANIALSIMGVLLVASEWSQRTALITFTLVPDRKRVVAAKIAAGAALSLIALAVCILVAAIATGLAAPGVDGTWSLPAGLLGQTAVYLVTSMIIGIGFGAVLRAPAPAIVASFVVPTIFSVLAGIPGLVGAGRWLDPGRSLVYLPDRLFDATDWARAGTTLALWMVLPVLFGAWRISRSEIN
jgi:hypothetical protein